MKTNQIKIDVKNSNDELFIQCLEGKTSGDTVLCLHGSFSNGRVFYNKNFSRGLAPYLVDHGFIVYAPDFRGHGQSTPLVNNNTKHGMHENITEDLPIFFNQISIENPDESIHVIAHSDGGLLLTSFLARYPEWHAKVKSIVLLGTKRAIRAKSLKKFIDIDIIWYKFIPLWFYFKGYVPAVKLKLGTDNDSKKFSQERMPWLKGKPWVDPRDQFDYQSAWNSLKKPALKAYAAINDPYLGNPVDVLGFIKELGYSKDHLTILSKKNNYQSNYNHSSMLTDKGAADDYFAEIIEFLNQSYKKI